MSVEFRPMRSVIYVDVCREEYRHRLQHWLYGHHIQDSISNFGPYVTKYAFYNALPVPPEGERFGTRRMQMTEHYWLVNEMEPEMRNKAIAEYMPMDVLRWQGCVPDTDETPHENLDGDVGRSIGGDNGCPPFVFAHVPISWEEDFKGKGRMVCDGPNYRWQFVIQYPDGVSEEEGERSFTREQIRELALEAIHAQRDALLQARDEGVFSSAALEGALARLDNEEILLVSSRGSEH